MFLLDCLDQIGPNRIVAKATLHREQDMTGSGGGVAGCQTKRQNNNNNYSGLKMDIS